MWLNNGRTIPVHAGQTQDLWKVPEAVKVVVCGWTWATWGSGSCQLLHKFFSRFYHMKDCVPGKVHSSLLGTTSSLSSFSTSLTYNMSTPCQYPYSAGKLSGMWNRFGQGQRGQTAGEEGATQHYCLFKWKPRTIKPLMCYNPFDYSHFWLSVNNVLNG